MVIDFIKMQALGNDFVVITDQKAIDYLRSNNKHLSALGSRKFGVGCDQIVLVHNFSHKEQIKMEIFNQDGSLAQTCGNAARCVALLISKAHQIHDFSFLSSDRNLHSTITNTSIAVNMGKPQFNYMGQSIEDIAQLLKTLDANIQAYELVSVGNPHLVLFYNHQVNSKTINGVGGELSRNYALFSEGINVEFVTQIDDNNLFMKVYERGVGETLACGSGACASFAAFYKEAFCKNHPLNNQINVIMDGGALALNKTADGDIIMQGEAREVFKGSMSIDE